MSFHIDVSKNLIRRGIDIHIVEHRDGKTYTAQPAVFQELDDEAIACDPVMRLPMEAAQMLMDQLWRAGIRPDDFGEPAGALQPTQAHLMDMRAIAFELLQQNGLPVTKPEDEQSS